ncbi:unnamed protein product [Phyllotreta striolata]|uniref:Uncharacterized protein n=1 Tax=Phyllotreta striolata TaxID=444603 RepID=A0A9N9TMK7_PHYSR|nr:unnamed protein product [Phyllotreta striolata]
MKCSVNCVILQNIRIMKVTGPPDITGCYPCEPDPEMKRIIDEYLIERDEDGAQEALEAAKKKLSSVPIAETNGSKNGAKSTKNVGVQCELLSDEQSLRGLIDQCAKINPDNAGNFKKIVKSCARFTESLWFPVPDDALSDISDISTFSDNRRTDLKRKASGHFERVNGIDDENYDCSNKKSKKQKSIDKVVKKKSKTKDKKTSKTPTRHEKQSEETSLKDHSKSDGKIKKFRKDFVFYSEKYMQESTSRRNSLKSTCNGEINVKKLARSWWKVDVSKERPDIDKENAGNFKKIVKSCARFTESLSFPVPDDALSDITDISTFSDNRRNDLKRKASGHFEKVNGIDDENYFYSNKKSKKQKSIDKVVKKKSKKKQSEETSLTDHSKSVGKIKKFRKDFVFHSEKYMRESTSPRNSPKSTSDGEINVKKLARNWWKVDVSKERPNIDKDGFLDPNKVFLHPTDARRKGARSLGNEHGTYQEVSTFRCEKGSKSLVERKKRRRLYSESVWLNSASFDAILPEL